MAKRTETAKRLNDLLAERFFALSTVKDDVKDDPRGDPQPPTAYWHEADGVANWSYRLGTNSRAYADAVAGFTEELRKAYDIEEPKED